MPARVNRLVRPVATLVAITALALVASVEAFADETGREEVESNVESEVESADSRWRDWVPSAGFAATFTAQGHDSKVSSTCDGGGIATSVLAACTQGAVVPGQDPRNFDPALIDEPSPLRPSDSGSDFPVWPSVGLDLQLASPVLFELPFELKPRMFVGATLTAAFPPTRTIATEGNRGEITEPETRNTSTNISTVALEGAGSQTESVAQTFEYAAQVGVAIPLQYRGRTINIKPMFGWAHWKLDVTGRVSAAVKDDVNGVPGSENPFGANTREIYLKDSETLDVHGIGPGIEIEYISGQFGSIGTAVYASANAYKVMGKKKLKLDDAVTFEDGTVLPDGDGLLEDTYRGHWEHEIDPWFYRLRIGIRFHYDPQ